MDLISLSILESIDEQERERLEEFKTGWAAYEGDMTAPLRTKIGEPSDNIILPFVRSFVNTGIHFLFGDDLKMEGGDDTADEAVARAWNAGAIKGTQKMLTLTKLGINGGVTGQPFIKLNPRDDHVHLNIIDPAYVSVNWSQEDIDEVTRYRLQWPIIDEKGKPAARRQDHERDGNVWHVTDYISRGPMAKWERIGEVEWGFSFPAIVETQNLPKPNEYWGESDLVGGVLAINNALNSVMSDVRKILRYHAGPKTVAKGLSKSQFQTEVGPGEILFLPEADQDLYNLELSGDLAASMETYRALKEALHQIGSLPEVATGKVDNVGQLSARAMAILYKPLVGRTSTKRLTYGHQIDTTNRRVLEIRGVDPDNAPEIQWPEILPRDALEERQVAEADLRMGIVSKRTTSSKLGYDFDTEQEQMKDERQSVAETALTQFDTNRAAGDEVYDPAGQRGANSTPGR